ncbi:hypothetical protein CAPTEDRAFT_189661 [Capitella teleta]|uniref:Uncharacterized protein n=1 Tax=Capitella teleta TaxID=283909 RepID=R7TQF7_CAPTE|nr:hypothetical protein CAPTEDRAFT_189661 [Capitella teleta]|eukprot:ELT93741.1 hypothetical protein CAPTEDRAFT_189661 [Capitella teleta]
MFYFLGVLEHSTSALRCLNKLIPKLRHINESVVNAKDDFGWTPANLMFANLKVTVENSADLNRLNVELLTSFFESGLHPAEIDRHGASLLHHAAGTGSCGALEMLIKQCELHVLNSVDSFSSTPLHFAVAATQREATEILLKSEIDKNAKDCKGRTALDLAKLFGSENIMQLLDKNCNVIHEPERQFNLHRIHKNQDTISEVEMNAVLKSPLFGSMDKQDACFQEEANRVKDEVLNFMKTLSELYNKQHTYFSFWPKLRGSMGENTKCGPADEFDFMLVMDGLTEHYEVEKVNFSNVHLSLAGTTTSARQQVIELDNTFHHFNETFHAILMKSETWKKTRLKFVYFRSIRVGANLAVSYNGFLHKLLTISIDLVPCLPLAPDVHPPEICWPIPFYYSECRCYAMLGKNADSQSWPKMHRISNTDYEEVLMRSVPQAARNAYVVTKATRSQADSKSQHIPTSYQMKTALLDYCARLLRNKEDVDSVSIAEWVRMIFEHTYEKHAIPLLQALVRSKEKEDERLRELRRRRERKIVYYGSFIIM